MPPLELEGSNKNVVRGYHVVYSCICGQVETIGNGLGIELDHGN
jgi:hypothetical protein